jgi:hypothetical protein
MTHQAPLEVPVAIQCDEALLLPPGDVPSPPHPSTPADPDQVRALEAAFSAQERESHAVAGLLGTWTGAMLLHDLATETFTEPAGEVEPEEKKNKKEKQ